MVPTEHTPYFLKLKISWLNSLWGMCEPQKHRQVLRENASRAFAWGYRVWFILRTNYWFDQKRAFDVAALSVYILRRDHVLHADVTRAHPRVDHGLMLNDKYGCAVSDSWWQGSGFGTVGGYGWSLGVHGGSGAILSERSQQIHTQQPQPWRVRSLISKGMMYRSIKYIKSEECLHMEGSRMKLERWKKN